MSEQIFFATKYYLILLGINTDNIHRFAKCDAETFALTNGVVRETLMLA